MDVMDETKNETKKLGEELYEEVCEIQKDIGSIGCYIKKIREAVDSLRDYFKAGVYVPRRRH